MSTPPTWQVTGDYFEACNCESTCPCSFLADPSHGDCRLTVAWHIDRGHFGATRLEGLNVVGVFYTPGNMVTGPKWRAALYLDERASPEQSAALDQIFAGRAGGFMATVAGLIGEMAGIRAAPIHFEANGRRRRLQIPDTLRLEIEGLQGGDPAREPMLTNPALYAGVGFDPVIAHSTHYSLHDHGFEWDNSGKNAFYSRFTYSP